MIEQIISLAPEQEVNCGRSARPRVLVCPQSFHPLPIPPCPSPMMRPGIQHWSALIYCMNCCVSCPVSLAVSDRVYATGRGTVIAGRTFSGHFMFKRFFRHGLPARRHGSLRQSCSCSFIDLHEFENSTYHNRASK